MESFAVNMMNFSHHGDGVLTITLKVEITFFLLLGHIGGYCVAPKVPSIIAFPFQSLLFLVFKSPGIGYSYHLLSVFSFKCPHKCAADEQKHHNEIFFIDMVFYRQ